MNPKKYTLTGGPGSGKSSIILALEQRGEGIVREAAEDYIKLQKAKGIEEPWLETDFQDKLLDLQLYRETEAEKLGKERVFLDRGTLDGLAYYEQRGQELSEKMKQEVEKGKDGKLYEKVFLIENLGSCETNEIRREEQEEALQLERLLEENYQEQGYEVIRIGSGTVEERTDRILEYLDTHTKQPERATTGGQ